MMNPPNGVGDPIPKTMLDRLLFCGLKPMTGCISHQEAMGRVHEFYDNTSDDGDDMHNPDYVEYVYDRDDKTKQRWVVVYVSTHEYIGQEI